jgi:uncharacterized protein
MKVVVTGSSGLVGQALVSFLQAQGCEVARLVRTAPKAERKEIFWNPDTGQIDSQSLEGFDAVVHLAGENLATGRWTKAKKQRIRNSRVLGTKLLSETLATLDRPPAVMVSASAVGYYGSRGTERLTEQSAAGTGFLAGVCQEWEQATRPAEEIGVRVIHSRFGVILSAQGGALAKMLTPFKLGLGGVLGSGDQYWSWIALEDTVRGIWHGLTSELSGPVNFVSPHPVTNREFTRSLGKSLRRPTIMTVPRFALRLAFGEMAEEALLASTRVEPTKLLSTSFDFVGSELDGVLDRIVGGS